MRVKGKWDKYGTIYWILLSFCCRRSFQRASYLKGMSGHETSKKGRNENRLPNAANEVALTTSAIFIFFPPE